MLLLLPPFRRTCVLRTNLSPLNHLIVGSEALLHHRLNLLSFKLQLLSDQVHLQ